MNYRYENSGAPAPVPTVDLTWFMKQGLVDVNDPRRWASPAIPYEATLNGAYEGTVRQQPPVGDYTLRLVNAGQEPMADHE